MTVYLLRHLQVMLFSLGRLWRQPVASLMTITVIGIALVLPAGLFVLSENMSSLSNRWDSASQITLFLQKDVSPQQANQLTSELQSWPEIEQLHYQSAQQSLEEFRQLSGLGDVLDSLPNNPLPAIIVVEPADDYIEKSIISQLVEKLNALPEVEQAKLDMEWLQRFRSINQMVQRGVTILAILLSLSVVLAIGNTIRLAILSRESEIRVMKLVGATRSIYPPSLFIHRFLVWLSWWAHCLDNASLYHGAIIRPSKRSCWTIWQ
ncbi:MAG: permease-like cell division protein FtsX [Gammaproteobacteria bacterium]|nr:permease-like cell division protein FtsX [Gammaproteobacteria bacterium]